MVLCVATFCSRVCLITIFQPEDGGNMILWNLSKCLLDCTASRCRLCHSWHVYSALLFCLERMSVLLPADKKQVSLNILPRREPFEILYRLNCENLCADFREDLEFRFSWGLTSIIARFAGKKAGGLALKNYTQRVSTLSVSLLLVYCLTVLCIQNLPVPCNLYQNCCIFI